MPVEFEELELPFGDLAGGPAEPVRDVRSARSREPEPGTPPTCVVNRDPLGTFPCCPLCGGELHPEHAHFRCACGWRDSCCD